LLLKHCLAPGNYYFPCMKQITWGIIGPGKIARKFADAIKLVEGARLGAVASRDAARSRDFAEAYKIPRAYDSYEALAEDRGIDAVYIATPHSYHAEHTILCLKHQKGVLCEKPLALNAHEVEAMIDAAVRSRSFLMEGMWTHFLPLMREITELCLSGAIGKIKYIRGDFGFFAPFDPSGRLFDLRLGGGALLDVGIYPLYLCLHLLGEPENIVAAGHLSPTGSDETCHAILQWPEGQSAIVSSTLACTTSTTIEVAGTEGMIRIPGRWFNNDRFEWSVTGGDMQLVQLEPRVNGFEYQIREVMNCMEKGLIESPSLPHSFSLLLSKTMDTIRKRIGVRYEQDQPAKNLRS
jgi:predicted dehydrogenase